LKGQALLTQPETSLVKGLPGDVLAEMIAAMALLLLGYFGRHLWAMVSRFSPNSPRIKGDWTTEFTEPTEVKRKTETLNEHVNLKQVGRFVWGTGKVIDDTGRTYTFRGRLVRATFVGTFKAVRRSGAVGTGAFQLQVAGTDQLMTGWCTWHDADTDRIEASKYVWRKILDGR
jgi:hypothetical protein